ncbi:helix-turn-helix domain-containing protein [Streptomyces fuscichromogenes]|uniref:helix-turn-helix domain-containing protein n=1 Tax=Streptomyces fuscichromogenes TaxID=1324013 RepID=UPI0038161183
MPPEGRPPRRFRISDVASAVGVSPQTLRVWEQNGLITPTRSPGGQRYYTESDIDRARRVAQLRSRHGVAPTALADLPEPSTRALGTRIRELRRHRSLTQEELALRVGLSRSHLAAIERGDASLTFAVVSRLASALDVSARDLGPSESSDDLVVRSESGSRTDLAGVIWEELAAPGQGLEPALLLVPPGTASGNAPTDRPGTTFLYVLEGVLDFELSGRPDVRLTAGDAITLPPGLAWTWRNCSDRSVRALYVETSARQALP